jgi:hypothetical protein
MITALIFAKYIGLLSAFIIAMIEAARSKWRKAFFFIFIFYCMLFSI